MKTIALVTSSLLLVACGSSVPDCSNPVTVSTVKQLFSEQRVFPFGSPLLTPVQARAAGMKFETKFDAIRTLKETKGSYTCSGIMHIRLDEENVVGDREADRPLTYESYLTDAGKHYVRFVQ